MNNLQRPFDLVVLDLDGTILDLYHNTAISPVVRSVINEVQAVGIPVTIGTGRTLDYVRAHTGALGIVAPVVTTQGAVIGDPVTGEVLHETDMPLEAARKVAAWIDEIQPISVLYFGDERGHTRIVQNRSGPEPDFYDHVFGLPRTMSASFGELLAGADAQPPIKFIAINDPEREADVAPGLKERFAGQLSITRTHPWLVEGTALGIDKGQGLLTLCELMGVDPQRVLAMGDNDNDIPMLQAAGFGIAMGNANANMKAIADWVAPSIEDDGAAVALRKWVLGQSI